MLDLFFKKYEAIEDMIGLPPETLNTLQKLANSKNNKESFYNAVEQE